MFKITLRKSEMLASGYHMWCKHVLVLIYEIKSSNPIHSNFLFHTNFLFLLQAVYKKNNNKKKIHVSDMFSLGTHTGLYAAKIICIMPDNVRP